MPDREAVYEVALGEMIESLPLSFVTIGDAAYIQTERLCPIFYTDAVKKKQNDNFNYYASQMHIWIEMAFGLLQMK